jgi:hypothetical protein
LILRVELQDFPLDGQAGHVFSKNRDGIAFHLPDEQADPHFLLPGRSATAELDFHF